MVVLVTGGTGFIGRHVVGRLLQSGHRVRCLVRKTSRLDRLPSDDVENFVGDVTDRNSVLESLNGCDWVINLAGLYSFWIPRDGDYHEVNVSGARIMAECALESGVSKFIHVSTAGIFGRPDDSPFTENSDPGPTRFSRYFQTKYEGEMILRAMHDNEGLPLVVIYPCAVLGPDDPKTTGQYIDNLINRRLPATVAEKSVFTFVHVNDVAEAIVRAAEKDGNIGEGYIIGNTRLSFGEVNKLISEASGVPLPKISLPDFMAMANARVATLVANITKKPPLWGLAVDQIRVMIEGAVADGSKVERELGIRYTPIRTAIHEEIASIRGVTNAYRSSTATTA